jgi:glycosyltransferase involved in cell wall biosynthesis
MLHLVYEKHWVPSTRIRLRQLQPALARAGFATRLHAVPRDRADRQRFAASVGPEDRVLVHRARPDATLARFWQGLGVPLVFDFDDAIMFGRKSGAAGVLERHRRRRGFERMLRCCDAVTPGNRFLAEQCHGFEGPIEILPSAVPSDVPQHSPADGGPLRVGWIGRASNLRYLAPLAGTLRRVAERTPLELVIVSDAALDLAGVETRFVPWSLAREAREVAAFDVGVMPLALAGPWSRGKCAYKLLQYMAAGVPAVASRVGMNETVIRHGENGWLASDEDDWVEALTSLASDPEAAARMGRAGRATVEASYSIEAVARQLVRFLDTLSNQPRNSGSVRSSTGSSAKSSARARSAAVGGR